MKFAEKVDKAWKEYEKGKFKTKTKEEFLKELADDLEFAKRTDKALKRVKAGKGVKIEFDKFVKEMRHSRKN